MQISKSSIEKDFFWATIFILFIYFATHNPITHPIPKIENDGNWTIEQMQRPLLFGIAGHNFLTLRDSDGNIVSELHGLATDTTTGQAKFATMNNKEKLKVWEFLKPKYNLLENKFAGEIIAKGDKDTILSAWSKAQSCADEINKENIAYPSFGFILKGETENSNSVTYTLSLCMGIDNIRHLGLIVPGDEFNLLETRK